MKIKSNIVISDDKLMLLGALGLMVYNAMPAYDTALAEAAQKAAAESMPAADGEETDVQPVVIRRKNYIQKAADILSSDGYRPIKALYKIQNIIDDIGSIGAADAAVSAVGAKTVSSEDFTDIFRQIRPYLNDTKLGTVNDMLDNIDKTKRTVKQVRGVKQKLSSLPPETPRGERIKTLLEQIPTITGIPVLENVSNIKNLLGLLKAPENAEETAGREVPESGDGDDDKAGFDDIFDLVGMLHK